MLVCFSKKPIFTNDKLYVALSTVKSRKRLKLLLLYKNDRHTNKLQMLCIQKFLEIYKQFL